MKSYDFLKLIPGGNPTILIRAPWVPEAQRMSIALKLMDPLHLQAEQVGFIRLEDAPPRLDMMGGEFCLNATRCLVFELARQGRFLPLEGTDDLFGLLESSGMPEALQVRVKDGKKALYPAGSMGEAGRTPAASGAQFIQPGRGPAQVNELECFVSINIRIDSGNLREIEKGAVLVRLPGISHLLLDEKHHYLTKDLYHSAAAWRKKLGLEQEAASGVVWYGEPGPLREQPLPADKPTLLRSITPVVHVTETNSSIMESACGSASLALALLSAARRSAASSAKPDAETDHKNELFLNIRQPSGEALRIKVEYAERGSGERREMDCRVEVGGLVRLCAAGQTFI